MESKEFGDPLLQIIHASETSVRQGVNWYTRPLHSNRSKQNVYLGSGVNHHFGKRWFLLDDDQPRSAKENMLVVKLLKPQSIKTWWPFLDLQGGLAVTLLAW